MGGWYVFSMVEENGQLKSELSNTSTELANTKLTLQNEKERFSQTIQNYDTVMSKYLNDVNESTQRNRQLQNTISRLSAENEEFQQCMQMELPTELIDEIFTEGYEE